jgi:hypothetical protein
MRKNHFNQYENALHEQLLKLFHSVENRRFVNRLGPKLYCNFQKFALIVLFKRSGKALRKFIKELPESRWLKWLNFVEIPSKTSLHRWIQEYSAQSLREIVQILLKNQKPSLVAIDATGLESWQRSRHYENRLKDFGIRNPYMPYAKVDFLVDTDTLLIHEHTLSIKPRHDVLGAKRIFKRTRLKGVKVLGDKGYDCEELHEIARQNGLELFAPVRKSSRNTPKGFWRRKCKIKDPDYNRRPTVESVMHAFKSQVHNLRSKLHYMKKKELTLAVLVYNIERMIETLQTIFEIILSESIKAFGTHQLNQNF